eukprot:gb/GECH01011891.1/.p1 GENE.gb/GECH01011891.1/~~gb/GECH01011891.1/.p1  ORF type:complete len:173 (+),score=36.15 gb/GECH01011891.1/:1-519(+)
MLRSASYRSRPTFKSSSFSTQGSNITSRFNNRSIRLFASKNNIQYINTEKAPKAVGPYNQAVKANGFLYVSGCLGMEPETAELVSEDVREQTKQALFNMKSILESGGSSLDHVVKTLVLVDDMKHYPTVNEVYSEYFDGNRPARSCFAVKGLPKGGKVEIEAVALEGEGTEE